MFARLKPKSEVFYRLFTEQSRCIQRGAETLTQLGTPGVQHILVAEQMVELEHECDRITHEVFRTLNSSFITPFDRTDIYVLGSALDDVMDHMEAATQLVTLYEVLELPEKLIEVVRTLADCANVTAQAMPRLASMKGLQEYWIRINELENTADDLYRTLLAELFKGASDALTVMKLKDIADELEDAADAFEKVSHVVESIVLKES